MPDLTENRKPATTVLIAEDDPVFRRVLIAAVSRTGLETEAVSNGEEAYERIQRGGVDFLVLDYQMPVRSGAELLEQMANETQHKYRLPPTILCTAKGFEIDGPALMDRYGLVAILHKPFSATQLAKLIFANLQ